MCSSYNTCTCTILVYLFHTYTRPVHTPTTRPVVLYYSTTVLSPAQPQPKKTHILSPTPTSVAKFSSTQLDKMVPHPHHDQFRAQPRQDVPNLMRLPDNVKVARPFRFGPSVSINAKGHDKTYGAQQ